MLRTGIRPQFEHLLNYVWISGDRDGDLAASALGVRFGKRADPGLSLLKASTSGNRLTE